MIIDLNRTTTSEISKKLVAMREESGVFSLTRVLTLIVSCSVHDKEAAIEAANLASNEHPMRIIVVVHDEGDDGDYLDAQVRVGSDAGASEVIVLTAHGEVSDDEESLVTGLLLPDAPVVVWWPGDAPHVAGASPLGRLAQRRITDAAASRDTLAALENIRQTYTPGDTDLSWTRLTEWRTQIVAALTSAHAEDVTSVRIVGATSSATIELLGTWLGRSLSVPVEYAQPPAGWTTGSIHSVTISTTTGDFRLSRVPDTNLVLVESPGVPSQEVSVVRKNLSECIAEELRRLDPDETFGEVLLACSSHRSTEAV